MEITVCASLPVTKSTNSLASFIWRLPFTIQTLSGVEITPSFIYTSFTGPLSAT